MNKNLRHDAQINIKSIRHGQIIGRAFSTLGFGDNFQNEIRWYLERCYSEGQRFYHTFDHVNQMLERMNLVINLETREAALLVLAVLFHDCVYDPTRHDNEERSAVQIRHFLQLGSNNLSQDEIDRLIGLVLSTKLFKYEAFMTDPLAQALRMLDLWSLAHFDMAEQINIAWKLFKEFQFLSWPIYVQGRAEFLRELKVLVPAASRSVDFALDYLRTMHPRVGYFAGSFCPAHVGHLSVLRQAEQMFDKVILGVGINRQKLVSSDHVQIEQVLDERCAQVRDVFRFHEVDRCADLLTGALQNKDWPVLVRGLRTDTDFKNEEQMLRVLQDLRSELRVVYVPCEKNVEHVSSTVLRELDAFGGYKGTLLYGLSAKEVYALNGDLR